MINRHFIIGGAQRSATTYLTRVLDAHPEIEQAKPVRPEPKFFLKPEEYEEGYAGYLSRYFSHVDDKTGKVLGEKSTSYIEHEVAARRIKQMLPDVRMIFLLRHPIERAISNINFSRMHDFENASTETAILREIDAPDTVVSQARAGISVSPQAYLARSGYVDHLKPYFEIFDRSQIKVLIKESLTGNPDAVKSIYQFLDVDGAFVPDILGATINASEKDEADVLSKRARSRLEEYFSAKNEALADLCDLDLSAWT